MSPRGVRDDRLKDRLLDAADALVESEGIGAFTVRRVARDAGVADGALYNHFADKGALLAAVTARRVEEVERTVVEQLATARSLPTLQAELDRLIADGTKIFERLLPIAVLVAQGVNLGRALHQLAPSFLGVKFKDAIAARLAAHPDLQERSRDAEILAVLLIAVARQLALERVLGAVGPENEVRCADISALMSRWAPGDSAT